MMWVIQGISLIGAGLILSAFALNQFGFWHSSEMRYSLINFIGAFILSVIAVIEKQYGFLLLEGTWSIISLLAILRKIQMLNRLNVK